MYLISVMMSPYLAKTLQIHIRNALTCLLALATIAGALGGVCWLYAGLCDRLGLEAGIPAASAVVVAVLAVVMLGPVYVGVVREQAREADAAMLVRGRSGEQGAR